MKIKKGQFKVTIEDVEKYSRSLCLRLEKVTRKYGAWSKEQLELAAKIDNCQHVLIAMRAAKVAQVDPTLTQSIPAHPQQ